MPADFAKWPTFKITQHNEEDSIGDAAADVESGYREPVQLLRAAAEDGPSEMPMDNAFKRQWESGLGSLC